MARFKYSFQKIVDLKSSEKMQAEWLLSDAIASLNLENEQLEKLKLGQLHWEEKLEQSVTQSAPLAEIVEINHYIEYYELEIKKKLKSVEQAEKMVERCRGELASKMKEEKVWDKAKEHAFTKFQYHQLIKEQNELDEMASIRFISPM